MNLVPAYFRVRCLCLFLGLSLLAPFHVHGQSVTPETKHDVSAPLRDLFDAQPQNGPDHEMRKHPPVPTPRGPALQDGLSSGSTASQSPVSSAGPTPGVSFDGMGVGFSGPNGSFTVNSAPPDPNGAVGPNHFVETVNTSFAVFTKSGTPLYGPVHLNVLWSGFGGGCQANNDGDPTVVYDKMSDRWVIQQFSVSTQPYLLCVAVSTTSDPTGSYYRYSFQYANFPDYPKLGIWPDAFYVTTNDFTSGGAFVGASACAMNRTKMLSGLAAQLVCFVTSSAYGGLLPSDFDGKTLPPSGSPNYFLALDTTSTLISWKFHVDFVTPSQSTFLGPVSLPVASYTPTCNGGTCIPQGGVSQKLDSLADRLMYRLAYRNFGTHEALVVNHSIVAGSSSGVRWYELRIVGGTPTLYQQGTYAPDGNWRWMGSAAMDQAGNLGMGYSVSGSSIFPQIHYTGRLVGDAPGTMTQGENTIVNGTGSQNGTLSRWGDYSSMSVDPADDCTFWYTNEYLKSTGSFNWSTRIASFKLPSCGSTLPAFSLSANPSSQTIPQGQSGSYTLTVTPSGGFTGAVSFSVSGLPGGAAASFNPASVTTSGNTVMTVATGTSTATGTYPLTVMGTSGAISKTTQVTLVVNAATGQKFSLSATPGSQTVTQGQSKPYTVTVSPSDGFTGAVSFSVSGLPAGASASFNPASVTTSGSSTMTITTSSMTPAGSYSLTVKGAAGSLSSTTSVSLVVLAVTPGFSISASPTSQTLTAGQGAGYQVTVTPSGGFTGAVTFSVSGLPSGTTGSFNPASVTTSGNTSLSVASSSSTPAGTYTLAIKGTSGTLTQITSVTLVVAAPVRNFTLAASPVSQTVSRGGTTAYSITVNRTGGFTGWVTLTVSGLPAGTTASFNPDPVTGTFSTLTVTTSSGTPVGVYPLNVTGKNESRVHSVSISLTVM